MPNQQADILAIPDFPFVVQLLDGPDNPAGMPNCLPFHLRLDTTIGHLYQPAELGLAAMLERAYRAGSLLGTAMDDTDSGRAYADDFLRFISQHLKAGTSCLEIGAGRGFLTRRLGDAGYHVTGMEPGQANAPHWQRHGVDIVADSFPSAAAPGPFDAILAYAVMEHIADLTPFLISVAGHLTENGRLIVAVPDCGPYIATGDPSILLHEHYHYFTAASLERALAQAGFRSLKIEPARYGGVLYCCAVPDQAAKASVPDAAELQTLQNYGKVVERQRARIADRVVGLQAGKQRLGIYCPNRVLGLLPVGIAGLRFFDDDPDQLGKHFPGFPAAIENRASLIASPADEIWIMSRSFGTRIRDRLQAEPALAGTRLQLIDQVLA